MRSPQQKTYRSLAQIMGPVDLGDDRPEWAREYAIGDTIAVRHPETAKIVTAPLAGFSTRDEYYGLPAIVTPPELTDIFEGNVRTVVIRERDHVAGGASARNEDEGETGAGREVNGTDKQAEADG